ncbi:MAG: FecR domain-containing protein [Cyclobacteriaceae bacterium]
MDDLDRYSDLINHDADGPEDELAEFLQKSADAQIPESRNKDAIWGKISSAIDEDKSKSIGFSFWTISGIAAAITIIVSFAILFSNNNSAPESIQIITQSGENLTKTLPDGSVVNLNASSSISYSDDWNREISLKGEAFFEVSKGEKFIVKTPLGDVQVLGTSFNVFARDGDFEVACKTGKVKVMVPQRLVDEDLIPGQAITVKTDTVQVVFRVPESIGKWKTGEFSFESQPLSKVFEEFERQFSIEIEFNLENNDQFSGYFRNDINVEQALESVCVVMNLEYQRTGDNKFTISESSH